MNGYYPYIPRYINIGNNMTDIDQALAMKKDVNIIKSDNDVREYKYLVLKNKMKMLLISDPSSEKSAASVNLHVGHTSDPDKVPGLAHFCEHMLFLGTEKYPEEGEYRSFIKKHGGRKNASTSAQHTNYYFDIKSESFFEGVDRFAHFFISPLFNADATNRELNAIDSEHQKNILNDSRRKYYINKATAKPEHVYRKFGTGNLETLKTVPEKEDMDIRELLLDFYKKYYSSNIMTVALLGSETLEELEGMLVPLFEKVQNGHIDIPEVNEFPYGDEELGILITVPSIKDIKKLQLRFTIPDLEEHYKSNPASYITRLIGHEGKGSLLSLLKKNLWVNQLSCGSYTVLKGFGFFDIDMDLTDEGLNKIFEIISVCFQYIQMLKTVGPKKWIYDEMRKIVELKFKFKDKETPISYVQSLSSAMHVYPLEDVLCGSYCREDFQPELINKILSYLSPWNFRCTVQAQKFEGNTDRSYKYYNAGYSLVKLPKEKLEELTHIILHPDLHLPNENIFVPDSLEVIVNNGNKIVKGVPCLVKDNDLIRVWYKADDTFFLPKAVLKFHITTPYSYVTPWHLNHSVMFTKLLRDELVEFGYDASKAGLSYEVYSTQSGFVIKVSGFNSKQLLLLKEILSHVINLDIKPPRFHILKKKYEESLYNVDLEEPYQQINGLLHYLTIENSWSAEDKLKSLHNVNIDSLNYFIPEMLKSIYIESFLSGNLLLNDVQEIVKIVEEMLLKPKDIVPLLSIQHMKAREYELRENIEYLYEKQSKVHANSCVLIYMQIGLQETRVKVLCELFSQISAAEFFSTLRTKEQLGYLVTSRVLKSISVIGLMARIQSDKDPIFVKEKIDEFFESFEDVLHKMTDDQFQGYIEGLAVEKLEKPKRLGEEASKFWHEIMSKQYNFRRSEMEVEVLRTLTKEDVVKFYRKCILPSSENSKRFVLAVLGKDVKSLSESERSWHLVEDVLSFRTGLPLYSHILPHESIPLASHLPGKS